MNNFPMNMWPKMLLTLGSVMSRYNLHIPLLLINRNHVIIFKEVSGQFEQILQETEFGGHKDVRV